MVAIKYLTLKIVRNKKFWKDVDFIIWIVPFILVHLSCLLIASTQRNLGITDWYQHAIIAYIGSLIVYFLAQFPLQDLRKYIIPIYFFTILTLLYVNFSGTSALGAQRWLSFAGLYIQPSEFAKITLILVLASILDRKRFSDLSHLIKPLLVSFFLGFWFLYNLILEHLLFLEQYFLECCIGQGCHMNGHLLF